MSVSDAFATRRYPTRDAFDVALPREQAGGSGPESPARVEEMKGFPAR